jgi:hypothetical protein
MRKQRKQKNASEITLRLWTYPEAQKVVPYLRTIVRSLRDIWLEIAQARRQIRRLDAKAGRADRHTLILREEGNRDVARAEAKLEETLREMSALSAYCLDPAGGLALIPFRHGRDLAWFVFDLFGPNGLVAWRLYSDPLETRRSLADLEETLSA